MARPSSRISLAQRAAAELELRRRRRSSGAPTLPAPQEGPQTAFVETPADIAFYGGAAGGGKSWGLRRVAMENHTHPAYTGVVFRRTSPQIRQPGGMWDRCIEMYCPWGAAPKQTTMDFAWPAGGRVQLAHLEHERDKLNWQGGELADILWDELPHFTESQFEYVSLSRGRSVAGLPIRVRATLNPAAEGDPGDWVRKWVEWYIGEDGFPIPERSGVLRWFYRQGDELVWFSSRGEAEAAFPERAGLGVAPKSFTFISARLTDNRVLMEGSPEYLAGLWALPERERMALLEGNWNISLRGGGRFHRDYFTQLPADPAWSDGGEAAYRQSVRAWDFAATEGAGDWTAGAKLGHLEGAERFVIRHIARGRKDATGVVRLVAACMLMDGPDVLIRLPGDPATASGWVEKDVPRYLDRVARLVGMRPPPVRLRKVRATKPRDDEPYTSAKDRRARPLALAAAPVASVGSVTDNEITISVPGRVDIVAAPWTPRIVDQYPDLRDWIEDEPTTEDERYWRGELRAIVGLADALGEPPSAAARNLDPGAWWESFLREAHAFDGREGGVDDQVDATADALDELHQDRVSVRVTRGIPRAPGDIRHRRGIR